MKFEFHPRAEAELLESIGFYESKVQGLGEAFLMEFEAAVQLLCDATFQRQVDSKPDIRRAPLHRFPFTIIYRKKESTVQILAVAHNRRRPQYWLERA